MAKRNKSSRPAVLDKRQPPAAPGAARLPQKQPALLLASVLLFTVWFVFLLVTAFTG
jgi:hypothetical protein